LTEGAPRRYALSSERTLATAVPVILKETTKKSHHLDSPLARQDVRLDIADLYVFRGTTGTVLVLDVNSTISGGPAPQGFHPEARYEFRVDLDGDAVQDVTYRLTFGERDADGQQDVELRQVDGAGQGPADGQGGPQ
jgi:hypothetical protein